MFSSQILLNNTNTNSNKTISLISNARSSSPYQLLNDQDHSAQSNQGTGSPNIKQTQLNVNNPNTPKNNDNQSILAINSNNNQTNSSNSSSSSPSPISSATSLNNKTNTTIVTTSTIIPNQNMSSPNNMSVNSSLESNNITSTTINPIHLLNSALLDSSILNNTQTKYSVINSTNTTTPIPLSLTLNQQQQLQQQLQRQQQQNLLSNFKTDLVLNSTTQQTSGLIDMEKEKLKQDLIKQTEMSNKLETLCLQYRQVHLNFK